MKKLKKLFKIFLLVITMPIYILRIIICCIFWRLAKLFANRNLEYMAKYCYYIANFVSKETVKLLIDNEQRKQMWALAQKLLEEPETNNS